MAIVCCLHTYGLRAYEHACMSTCTSESQMQHIKLFGYQLQCILICQDFIFMISSHHEELAGTSASQITGLRISIAKHQIGCSRLPHMCRTFHRLLLRLAKHQTQGESSSDVLSTCHCIT